MTEYEAQKIMLDAQQAYADAIERGDSLDVLSELWTAYRQAKAQYEAIVGGKQ